MDFVAEGCSKNTATSAVTFAVSDYVHHHVHYPEVVSIRQAGTSQGELYKFAEQKNISLPGGADATVGAAGGYVQVNAFSICIL